MYKVFVNDKPIIITDSKEKNNKYRFLLDDETSFKAVMSGLNDEAVNGIVLYCSDLREGWKRFQRNFIVIEAAGGLVCNTAGDTLFIKRFNRWDLPKGHIENGENAKAAAIREVEEECGISGLKIEKTLPITYHVFKNDRGLVLKVTHWFLMNTSYNGALEPQLEEGITKVVFKNEKEVKKALENTYANIRLLFN